MSKPTSTATKTKSARSIRHEIEPDNELRDLQINRDFANIILRTSDPAVEWSGDFDPEPWTRGNKLFFRDIHPVPTEIYGLDLRTNSILRDEDWAKVSKDEQVRRSVYRRASGKGWDPTEGQREVTITHRPDLMMTLAILGNPSEAKGLFHDLGIEAARKVEALTVDPLHPPTSLKCKLVLFHHQSSISHLHLKVWSVDDDGKLLWHRDAKGKVYQGNKGLLLLGPSKLAIMRLIRAGLIEGDDSAERAYNNRCMRVSKTGLLSNGLPLDWTLTCHFDDRVEAFIKGKGPDAVATLKEVQTDYKKWLNQKLAASPFNLKHQNKELKARVEGLEKMVADLMEFMKTGVPTPKPAPEPEPDLFGIKVRAVLAVTRPDFANVARHVEAITTAKTMKDVEPNLELMNTVQRAMLDGTYAAKFEPVGRPVGVGESERREEAAKLAVRPVDERADEGHDIAPPKATPQPVPAIPKAPEPEVAAKPSDWAEEPVKRKKGQHEAEIEDLLADMGL